MRVINAFQLKEMIDSGEPIQIIDARDFTDYEVYHIKDAKFIPRMELMERADQLSREIPVVIYCKYGMKSPPTIKQLENEKGFLNLYSLKEGIYEWVREYDRDALELL